jgi:preprotein translocase subunit SecA
MGEQAPAASADPYRGADGETATPPPSDGENAEAEPAATRVVDPDKATHELYRRYGAVIPLQKEFADREKALEKASRGVAASLIQQRERILDLSDEMIGYALESSCPPNVHAEDWDLDALVDAVKDIFNLKVTLDKNHVERESLAQQIWEQVEKWIEARQTELSPAAFLALSRHFYLEEIDQQWIDHLKAMDHLREGIGLRGYGQKDPKLEYKKEGYTMFAEMMQRLSQNVSMKLFRVQLRTEAQAPPPQAQPQRPVAQPAAAPAEVLPEFKHKERKMVAQHSSVLGGNGAGAQPDGEKQKTVVREQPKVGRNEPCPCGSGKKYKKCHGATAVA